MRPVRALRNPLKRLTDITGALTALILLAPVLVGLWVTVRIKLGAPVLFIQQRPGKDGKTFALYKFRSMLEEDPARGLVTDDERMTPFGRRLRATSLDELPTLLNVLKGDMSLVGPRPLVTEYLPLYTPQQARRHEVRPGITGLAQVSGRNLLSWEQRFNLDVDYVDRHNLVLDVAIMFKTLGKIFDTSDIAGDGISTMTMFVGAPPQDGLTEEIMHECWHNLWDSWRTSDTTIALGAIPNPPPENTRHWVYLLDPETPVGITGLTGLGTQHLHASILLGPEQHDPQLVKALTQRLIHHAKTFDAAHLTLHIPANHRLCCRSVQTLGFTTSTTATVEEDPIPVDGHYRLAYATKTGT